MAWISWQVILRTLLYAIAVAAIVSSWSFVCMGSNELAERADRILEALRDRVVQADNQMRPALLSFRQRITQMHVLAFALVWLLSQAAFVWKGRVRSFLVGWMLFVVGFLYLYLPLVQAAQALSEQQSAGIAQPIHTNAAVDLDGRIQIWAFALHVVICTWMLCEAQIVFGRWEDYRPNKRKDSFDWWRLLTMGGVLSDWMALVTIGFNISLISILVLNEHYAAVFMIWGIRELTVDAFQMVGDPSPDDYLVDNEAARQRKTALIRYDPARFGGKASFTSQRVVVRNFPTSGSG